MAAALRAAGQIRPGSPGDELRRSLLTQLARQGWHVREGTLVNGDPRPAEAAPDLAPESLHPWVSDAARKLWESGHRRPAVQAAATAINERLQDKLGRHDLADDKLLQEAFSDKPAQPRLRIPRDPRAPTVASLQRGAPQFGVGCFWVIRNPATHETADRPPQEALEQLAALSVLARLRHVRGSHASSSCTRRRRARRPGRQPHGAGSWRCDRQEATSPVPGRR
jgi:Protein of unknown function (Hypoth_ymh)